jgi:hypothetical protein
MQLQQWCACFTLVIAAAELGISAQLEHYRNVKNNLLLDCSIYMEEEEPPLAVGFATIYM